MRSWIMREINSISAWGLSMPIASCVESSMPNTTVPPIVFAKALTLFSQLLGLECST